MKIETHDDRNEIPNTSANRSRNFYRKQNKKSTDEKWLRKDKRNHSSNIASK